LNWEIIISRETNKVDELNENVTELLATTGLMGPRSRSLPALGRSMPGDEEIQYRDYVSKLSQQMAERDVTHMAEQRESAKIEEDEICPETEGPASIGSIGHQWGLCRRPCIYHLACGTCTKGADCGFCHMPHADRVPKLDKQQRTMLQELGAGELLALVLEPLRAKVAQMGLEEDAVELIDLLESERAAHTSMIKTSKKNPKLHCVRKIMGRMSIAGLVGVAGYSQTGADFRDRLSGEVEKMRSQLQ